MSDLLEFVRQPMPETPEEMRAQLPAAEAALARLDAIRATAAADIERLTKERRRLLLDDSASGVRRIRDIDAKVEVLSLDIERGDEIETALVNRCRHLASNTKAHEAAQVVGLYRQGIAQFCAVMRHAVEVRERLVQIRALAARAGLEAQLAQLELPHANFPLLPEAIGNFERGATETLAHLHGSGPRVELFPIRFHAATGLYRVGETAGFDAATAWRLIDAGLADWASPTRRPPRPAAMGAV
ncbi:MAG TPA: hypothetical protein VMA37_01480 [Acetobacteraceae bacterium]|nr:hypothetical protein [Acetobacteraceae bacterium]